MSNKMIINQTKKISSFSTDKKGLKEFCEFLQERADAAAKIEVENYKRNDLTDEQYTKNIEIIKKGFELNVLITGNDNKILAGPFKEIFSSPNFPNQVNSFLVDSEATLVADHSYRPSNGFRIFFDFTKPKIFDFTLLPSQNTPNESKIEVKGYDPTWANGLFSEIEQKIDSSTSNFSKVHKHSIYDIFLWILGMPLAFWIVYRLSNKVEYLFNNHSVFLKNALYVYLFMVILFVFRVLFHYLRWVCPLVEYRSKKNKIIIHRGVLSAITLGLFIAFIYDLIKEIFNK